MGSAAGAVLLGTPDSIAQPRLGADPRLERLIFATSALITELSLDLLDLSRLDEDRLKPVIRSVEPGSVARRAIVLELPATPEES